MSTTAAPSTGFPRTVIGPLTTTFTPAPSCFVGTLNAPCQTTSCVAFNAQYCNSDSGYLQDATDCWPAASPGAPTPTPAFNGWGFYSPAFYCPSGYYAACSATGGGSSDWPVEFYMSTGETAIGCCPTGYTCENSGHQTCGQVATAQETITVATCNNGELGQDAAITLPLTVTTNLAGTLSSYRIQSFDLFNPMIEIRHQSSDLPASTSASQTPDSGSSNSSSGLSTGAEAGIGVGVALGVITLGIAGFLLWRRRRNQTPENVTRTDSFRKSELPGDQTYRSSYTALPQDNTNYEMEAYQKPQEISSNQVLDHERHELPGNMDAEPVKYR